MVAYPERDSRFHAPRVIDRHTFADEFFFNPFIVYQMEKKNETKAICLTVTDGLTVSVLPDSAHEFLMSSKNVAAGYGVSEGNIRNQLHRNKEEFCEGKHFGTAVCFSNSEIQTVHNKVFWTKRGIVRLGFFIKSDRARLFRDWAEDLIIEKTEQKQTTLDKTKRLQMRYVEVPEYKAIRDLIDSATMACGSATRLADRIGIHDSSLSHIKKRPWLVSDERLKGIELACRNILSRNASVDTETIEQLMLIQDETIRINLFAKMRKGGLI